VLYGQDHQIVEAAMSVQSQLWLKRGTPSPINAKVVASSIQQMVRDF
jgi:hypothetical protein